MRSVVLLFNHPVVNVLGLDLLVIITCIFKGFTGGRVTCSRYFISIERLRLHYRR